MAAALAEQGLHIGAEGRECIVRHERQQRPCKAAAVNPAGAAPGKLLMADIAARTLLTPYELATGVMTALVGAPVFILMASRMFK